MSNSNSEVSLIIEELAQRLAVDASFIEKDWYSMRIMGKLSTLEHPDLNLIFSGGTSLSKGFGLIERFSEDLDFKVLMPESLPTRSQRSAFRKQVIALLQEEQGSWQLDLDNIHVGNGSKFFKIPILYPAEFKLNDSMRPHIQLEVTFENPAIQPLQRPLQSIVGGTLKQNPEASVFPCISPIETAANKLSALTWRILSRDRSSSKDDPTLIRHLHDLAAMESVIEGSQDFNRLLGESMAADVSRAQFEGASRSPQERLQALIETLKNDSGYEAEYSRFVSNMSYQADEEKLTFGQSLDVLSRVVTQVQID